MISATPGHPIASDELARIAFLRTYAYAAALELIHKYQIRYSRITSGPDHMKKLALQIVHDMIEKDGRAQLREANTTWETIRRLHEDQED